MSKRKATSLYPSDDLYNRLNSVEWIDPRVWLETVGFASAAILRTIGDSRGEQSKDTESRENMVRFRRNYVPGGTYFFTVTLRDRRSRTLTDHIEVLRRAFQEVLKAHPFQTDAIVVLPEHLHAVLTLPENDSDYSRRWQQIKGSFSKSLAKSGVPLRKDARGEYRVWRRRFWEHTIRDEQDLETHVDYVHYNPVKHGLVTRVADWPYSSFHRHLRLGWVNAEWAADPSGFEGKEFGEPDGC